MPQPPVDQLRMKSFVMDFNDLIVLSNSLCVGISPMISIEELIKRLNDFKENYENNDTGNISHLKIRLLTNLMFITRCTNKISQKCTIINYMTHMLKTLVIDDIEFFILLYNSVFHQIYQANSIPLSEEVKLAVLECSIELMRRSTKRMLQLLYNASYGAKFSMGILIAATIAKEEKNIKLRTTALDFLLYSMQYHKRNDKVLQARVGDLFMLYLPGVIGRLEEIILRDETQPHTVTIKAITCWSQLLCTVMQDLDEEENLSDAEYVKQWMNLSKETNGEGQKNLDVNNALQEKCRSRSWLQAAALTLKPLISKLPAVRNHSHPKVRLELASQVSRLLDNCLINLKSVVSVLIEVLISSSEDEEEEVREVADLAIVRFESRCRDRGGQIYLNVIEDNLNSLINKIPTVIHLRDDKSILNAMQSLCGNFKILLNGGKLGQIICFSSNLIRLTRVLMLASRLDPYPEISLQDYSAWDDDVTSTNWRKEWKRFKHFSDLKIKEKLVEICRLMGRSGEVETIADYLLDKIKEDNSCRNECLLLINEVVSGSPDIQENIIRQFLDFYLDPDNLYLALEVDGDECSTLQSCRRNVMTVSLLMEGLGNLARVLGRRFDDYLLDSIYFVIEKMGSSIRTIRTSAISAGVEISRAIGLGGDVPLLIQRNVDYLTFHVTVKLRRDHPGVFDVVTTLMKNSPLDAVTNLEEIIINVLTNCSSKFESRHTMSYLRLFQTFVTCVNKWMKTSEPVGSRDEGSVSNVNDKSEVDSLLEFVAGKERKATESDDEAEERDSGDPGKDDDSEADDCQSENEKKANPPKHIQLTISIAESALNYLPSNELSKKLVVLEILNESVWILADRENELLPLVHKIWSPLVGGFGRVNDPLVISRSFTLLYSMSRTSKDFIRRRTLKNVLPALQDFLVKSSEKSKLKDSGTGYQYTQTFKLQKELLDKLGILAIDLRLSGKELDSILECSLPYLNSLQPLPLQENCRRSLMDFKNYDPYVVWYKLHSLQNEPEFSKNSQIVLDYIMSRVTT